MLSKAYLKTFLIVLGIGVALGNITHDSAFIGFAAGFGMLFLFRMADRIMGR